MDYSRNDDEWERMQRHRDAKEVDWVPYHQRRSTAGMDVQWVENEVVFVLTVHGLGVVQVRCLTNLHDPAGRLIPQSALLDRGESA